MDDRQAWLEQRRKGIGGSDAPVVCGLSPWKTPYQLWLEKRGEADGDKEESDSMFWGRTLEPVIRQRYADVTGRAVTVPDGILVSPQYPWMLASVDGLCADRILEVKTARMDVGWGIPGTAEIPEMYQVQVQHYLTVTELPAADVAVLIGGSDFRIYELEADEELQELIVEREQVFWRMVEDGLPPEPRSFEDLKLRYGAASRAATVQADPDTLAAVQRLKEIRSILKEEEGLKAVVMRALGEADTLVDGRKILVTWRLDTPGKRFDQKAFQAAHPDMYETFLKDTNPARRFLVK